MSRPLDPRLAAAAQAVRPGVVVADIGTDHGYLICELVGSGKCPHGFAADIRSGPLSAARRHIAERGLTAQVEAVLTDGLQGLPGESIDDVVIAGMGGELIAAILTAVGWTRDAKKRYVLQPMTRAEQLRRLLYAEGFALCEETAVESGRFVYAVMTAQYTGERRGMDELFCLTGLLLHKADDCALRYLAGVRERLLVQAAGLAQSAAGAQRAAELREIARKICRQSALPADNES